MIAGELVFVSAELLLHFTGILDMRDMLPVVHALCFAEIILISVMISTMKNRKRKIALLLQLTPILIGMVIDAAIYWLHLNIGTSDASVTILGVLIFLIVELFHVYQSSVSIYVGSIRSNLYREMAFVDDLTGIANRRAFDVEIDRIDSGSAAYDSLTVISVDANNLKMVNDITVTRPVTF